MCADGSLALGRFTDRSVFAVRLLRYPGAALGSMGMPQHRDGTWLTLLAQDEQGGLEVTTSSDFVQARPLPGSLIVNCGLSLQRASRGHYEAVLHKVVRKTELTRVSLICFYDSTVDNPYFPQ